MSAIPPHDHPTPGSERASILLVEDHEQVRASLRYWLSAVLPQFEFHEAASGEEAIQLAKTHRPRLVITDIGLPGISGLEAARAMLDHDPRLKVVVLSISDEACYRDDATRLGVSAFVPKSSMRTHLLPALHQALSSTPMQES